MDKGHTSNESNIVNKFNEYKDFIKDKHIEFVIKKTERISYGLYMLSNFIPHSESLHSEFKKTAHSLLQLVSRFASTSGISTVDIDSVHAQLQYMSSLLSLAYISSFISGSNIEIIKNEINYLHKHIEELSTRSATEGHLQIKNELFVVGQTKNIQTKPNTQKREDTLIKDTKLQKSKHTSKMSFIKNDASSKSKHTNIPRETPKIDREERIVEVIRDKGIVSIKDISTVVFDVSEKTIQRTLQTLIDKGHIKKEGERRWAKYQIV